MGFPMMFCRVRQPLQTLCRGQQLSRIQLPECVLPVKLHAQNLHKHLLPTVQVSLYAKANFTNCNCSNQHSTYVVARAHRVLRQQHKAAHACCWDNVDAFCLSLSFKQADAAWLLSCTSTTSVSNCDDVQSDWHSGSTARPRSSFWKSSAAASQLPYADEEQPVKHMSARAPLTAPVLSPRAPWLQGAALTAAKFRQPSRQHTARLAEHACIQMQVSTQTHNPQM